MILLVRTWLHLQRAHSCPAWTCMDPHIPSSAQKNWNTPSRWIRIGERKQLEVKKRLRIYDQTPFVNSWQRGSHFILTGPLPVCSTCFYSGGPLATPPWADGDHRQLHNEDCVHSLNDRPVHTSYKEFPHTSSHTHTHTNKWSAWQNFSFGSSVP